MADRGLDRDSLGFFDSVVMGVAGSAPAYSIAATTAVLVATVGLMGPAALLYCAIPMFGIALAFLQLGRREVNAGATYRWVGRALHPALGFMSGWSLAISATLFMVAGSLPAGAVTLSLLRPALASDTGLVTLVGCLWFALMAVLVTLGIRITANAQWIMSSVEIALLTLFAVFGIVHAAHHTQVPFSWRWFGLGGFHGLGGFAAGALVAAFYYWGWDVTANLSEETRQARRIPGLGGALGVVFVFVVFVFFTVATNLVLPAHITIANSADMLGVLGQRLWPGPGGNLLVLAVTLSTAATLETTLIQVTRTLYAMARDRVLPGGLARIHPRWSTPYVASVVVGLVALALFVSSNLIGSVGQVMTDGVNAIGLQICVYYGLAGIAVPVLYRREVVRSVQNLLLLGLWPVVGGLFMFAIGIYDIPGLGVVTDAIGLGSLAIGLVPLAIYWSKGRSYFHAMDSLPEVPPPEGFVEPA